MKMEVKCEKLGLRPGEQDYVLELLTKLAYATMSRKNRLQWRIHSILLKLDIIATGIVYVMNG